MEKEHNWSSVVLLGVMILFLTFSLELVMKGKGYVFEWEIMFNASASLLFNFYVDWVSVMFFGFVAMISGSVLFYSGSYMNFNLNYRLFMLLVLMFVMSMFFLVFSLNLVSMMLGWDGLGIVSYILVVFYKNEKSSSAGMITALSNRVGDAALMLSIACFLEQSSWSYMNMIFLEDKFVLWMVGLAAITKSAQIPFSAWLPAAMAAPTPVSALVHSSTLVTAGVYLLIRFSELMSESLVMKYFVYLGMVTTLMASLSALFEPDFKKVVALSTLSQLGIMIMTLSLGFVNLAFMHLLTHAVFKALLFMCSGKIIHSVDDYQDIRKMGGMIFNLPLTSMIMGLSSFALCGVPFLSGFYSKDLIIETSLMEDSCIVDYLMFMALVGLSASYSFRLMYLSVVNSSSQSKVCGSDEEDWIMLSSKMVLLLMSVVSGAFLTWSIMPVPGMMSLNFEMKWLAFYSMILGGLMGVVLCFSVKNSLFMMFNLEKIELIMMMWNLPMLSGMSMGNEIGKVSSNIMKFDLGWLEIFSGQGLNFMFMKMSMSVSLWFINGIKMFLLIFVMSLLLTVLVV
uniref:NADH-ubiquinone oxidoreductase chain 5 n=1 Tax=Cylisticus convexus TaxID=96835 RepID=A0A0G2T4J5_9CRUS|nr:NADH dehydrogenase subunit 5 [Cylisticus convexus]